MTASLAQGKQLLELFSGATTEQIQQFIEAGDLLKMMLAADLSQVDRLNFAELLQLEDRNDVCECEHTRAHHHRNGRCTGSIITIVRPGTPTGGMNSKPCRCMSFRKVETAGVPS